MPKSYSLGLDLGGTSLRASLMQETGRHDPIFDSAHFGGFQTVLADAITSARCIVERSGGEISFCGLALPGAISLDGRSLEASPTLSTAVSFAFSEFIESLDLPTPLLMNDANAAAFGEWHARDETILQMLYIRLGTGVGGAIISEGSIVGGAFGLAGEVGHVTAGVSGIRCSCGAVDCLEAYAGGQSLARLYCESTGRVVELPEIAMLASKGDEIARRLLADAKTALARATGTMINLFNPDLVIVEGRPFEAIASNIEEFLNLVRLYAMRESFSSARFARGILGPMAGAIGAAMVARNSKHNNPSGRKNTQ